MRGARSGGRGASPLSARRSARMCSGVVPQQPPSSAAPPSARFARVGGKRLGRDVKGRAPVHDLRKSRVGIDGRWERAPPRAASPAAPASAQAPARSSCPPRPRPATGASVVAVSTSAPVSSRPDSSKAMVATTGRSLFSAAARSAAFISYRSVKVSNTSRSASEAARTLRAEHAHGLLKLEVAHGLEQPTQRAMLAAT